MDVRQGDRRNKKKEFALEHTITGSQETEVLICREYSRQGRDTYPLLRHTLASDVQKCLLLICAVASFAKNGWGPLLPRQETGGFQYKATMLYPVSWGRLGRHNRSNHC